MDWFGVGIVKGKVVKGEIVKSPRRVIDLTTSRLYDLF